MVGKTNTVATGGDERQVPRHNFMLSILDALLLAPSPESVRHQSLFPCPPRVNSRVSRADTNEWYKATISAYDTTPKQLVVLITDCPMPQYVARRPMRSTKLRMARSP